MMENAFNAWLIWSDGAAPSAIDLQDFKADGFDPAAMGAIVLYDDPKQTLAWAVQDGRNPEVALSDWADTTRFVLELHRQDQSRVTLVRRPMNSLDQNARKQQLLELFDGNSLPSLAPQPLTDNKSALAWATLALLASDERRLLYNELCGAGTGGGGDILDADAALLGLSDEFGAVRQRDLLLGQIVDLERQLGKVSQARQRLWQEIKDLRRQLGAATDARERLRQDTKKLKTRLAAEADARKLIYASTSWRVTRPMRGFARLFKSSSRRSTAKRKSKSASA